jgi:hypothetical protein
MGLSFEVEWLAEAQTAGEAQGRERIGFVRGSHGI